MRTLHRQVSTVALVFLLWVSVTGLLLGIDRMWPPGPLDGPAMAEGVGWLDDIEYRLQLHNLLQELHRGSIIGLPGQLIDILTGLCVIFLSVSGLIVFVQVLSRRRKGGHRRFFWRDRSIVRSVHRWLGSALIPLLLLLTITGTATAIAQLLDPASTGPIPGLMPPAGAAEGTPPPGGLPPGGLPQLAPRPWNELPLATQLQDIHNGKLFGRIGETLMLIAGASVIVLLITGFIVYLTQWTRRSSSGKPELFWS